MIFHNDNINILIYLMINNIKYQYLIDRKDVYMLVNILVPGIQSQTLSSSFPALYLHLIYTLILI